MGLAKSLHQLKLFNPDRTVVAVMIEKVPRIRPLTEAHRDNPYFHTFTMEIK